MFPGVDAGGENQSHSEPRDRHLGRCRHPPYTGNEQESTQSVMPPPPMMACKTHPPNIPAVVCRSNHNTQPLSSGGRTSTSFTHRYSAARIILNQFGVHFQVRRTEASVHCFVVAPVLYRGKLLTFPSPWVTHSHEILKTILQKKQTKNRRNQANGCKKQVLLVQVSLLSLSC